MADLITPGPALTIVGRLLRPLLDPIPVRTKMPDPRPGTVVLCSRRGGVMSNPVTDRVMLSFHCWAPDDPAAELLANRVRGLLEAHQFAVVDGHALHGWREGGCSEFPDPAVTTQSRWQVNGTLGISAH